MNFSFSTILDPARRSPSQIDQALLWSALFLLLIGLVMVYSASIAMAEASKLTKYQSTYYLIRHAITMTVGFCSAVLIFQIPTRILQKISPLLFVIGFILLIAVLIPSIGREVNGARRWISLGIMTIQPSELIKLFAVLYAADYTVRKMPVMHDLKRALLPLATVMLLVGAMLLLEPDFGAFVVVIVIASGILFLGGMRPRLFALLFITLLCAFAVLIAISPYRRERFFGFLNPWDDALGKGYQLTHALTAFGRGHWDGVGLGASVEKLFYLPEPHTDFLLAVIGEELGLIGVLVVILLFVLIIQRAFAIGRRCVPLNRLYPALVAQGIGIWFGLQAFINMGVNMGVLPTKGLTLPLMSYGGSGIVVNCMAIAILLKIDWENRLLMRGGRV